jgi:hypothetical protein
MTNDDGRKPEVGSAKAGAGASSGVDGNGPKRFSVQRKMAIVARLLRSGAIHMVAILYPTTASARLLREECHHGAVLEPRRSRRRWKATRSSTTLRLRKSEARNVSCAIKQDHPRYARG